MTPADNGTGTDRLLDGENPTTDSQMVATRWVRIYGDLILAKDSLLTELEARIASSMPEAGFELEHVDGTYLTAQRARYQRRLAFWVLRQLQLTSSRG